MCPGWVNSSMGGPRAPKTLPEGANDVIKIIQHHSSLKSGSFYYNLHKQSL